MGVLTVLAMTELPDVDKDVLDFERQQWTYPGAKEQAILLRFGCSSTRYYQRLNVIISRDEALAYDPLLVRRLRRFRTARARQCSARRLGFNEVTS